MTKAEVEHQVAKDLIAAIEGDPAGDMLYGVQAKSAQRGRFPAPPSLQCEHEREYAWSHELSVAGKVQQRDRHWEAADDPSVTSAGATKSLWRMPCGRRETPSDRGTVRNLLIR
ncbi:hypothetical protein Tamer19_23000 [Cupriavidus sp. TA19]|nr:hypothetical protein Tamer19_23000 [Cupriavidus sp. TA19]